MKTTEAKPVELHGPDSPFPVAVAPKQPRLSAYDFSANSRQSDDRRDIQFGMDSFQCAKVLREIADRIERGEYILQSGRVVSFTRIDDFPMTALRLVFYEGLPREGKDG